MYVFYSKWRVCISYPTYNFEMHQRQNDRKMANNGVLV